MDNCYELTSLVLWYKWNSKPTHICYHSKARGLERHQVTFSLNQAGDKERVLDFTLNQSESEQQFEEDVFRGFSNEEYDRDGK